VEYKGDAYATNDDSKEKRALGQLWEKRSNGKGVFLFAEKSVNGSDLAAQLASKLT
jgi:type III restriction enzyme